MFINISKYLGCGIVLSDGYHKVVFRVSKFSDVKNIIIPMFKLYPILGIKAKDFTDFCEVAEQMNQKEHLNFSGLSTILKIKGNMNKGRKLAEIEEVIGSGEDPSFLYIYNRDKTILYHYTKNVKELSENLKIHRDTLYKHLKEGSYYLGKYSFSNQLSSSVLEMKNLSLIELNSMLNKDRERFKRKYY